jgi:hypothetical protein
LSALRHGWCDFFGTGAMFDSLSGEFPARDRRFGVFPVTLEVGIIVAM